MRTGSLAVVVCAALGSTQLLGAGVAVGDDEQEVEFIVASDVAWRAKLPRRLRVEEAVVHPGTRVQYDRSVVRWDGMLWYNVKQYEPSGGLGAAGDRKLANDAVTWFDGEKWTSMQRQGKGWTASVAPTNPDGFMQFSLVSLWEHVTPDMTLEQMIRRHPMLSVEKPDAKTVRLFIASGPYAADQIRKKQSPDGFMGWIVECDGAHGWRPVDVTTVVPIGIKTPQGPATGEGMPRVKFCGCEGLPWIRDRVDGWTEVDGVELPAAYERQTIPASVGAVINTMTVKGQCQVLTQAPEDVWFSGLPPEKYGRVGLLVDTVRGVTEHIDLRSAGERDDFRERVLDKLAEADGAPTPIRGMPLGAREVLAVLGGMVAGVALLWAIRRRRLGASGQGCNSCE